jgi:hypothetical protein
MHIQTIFPQIGVKISKPMLIRGNVATCAAIHRCEALGPTLGTLANSTSTGTPKYYA